LSLTFQKESLQAIFNAYHQFKKLIKYDKLSNQKEKLFEDSVMIFQKKMKLFFKNTLGKARFGLNLL